MSEAGDVQEPVRTDAKPMVLITGAAGNIGGALSRALSENYFIIGFDRGESQDADASYTFDLTSQDSVRLAMNELAAEHGRKLAAVIHLAAYFDFTGEESPLYEKVNEQGTRYLLEALQNFDVDRFIYSSTMLVHEAQVPGRKVNEDTPMAPKWAYPKSKFRTEEIIRREHGKLPYTILRLAGLYDEESAVPTISHQIARIYERDVKSHLYAGNTGAGQAFIHREDMIDAFRRVVDRRHDLPVEHAVLAGEDDAPGYEELQNRIGELIHGVREWKTLTVAEPMAKAGAWMQEKAEPVVPDAIDHGEKPFIRAFMIDMASDHYQLDNSRARAELDWRPRHNVMDVLPVMIGKLKQDPMAWYKAARIRPPDWMRAAAQKEQNPDQIRRDYESVYRKQHANTLWAHFINIALGFWLITSPYTLGYESTGMIWSDTLSGIALLIFATLSLSWRLRAARWICGAIGLWVLAAPLVFWAGSAAAYLNDTLVGMLIIGCAVVIRPVPGVSPMAAMTGPTIPPGWDYCPSSWSQRLPIIILALIGFLISRYLCAYQLGHISGVWEPFFAGSTADPQNGTEEIITSSVSRAWPVPDAGLGALTYALEILTGAMGSSRRWRTMPWLVLLFGIMIVPLGIVSITFIIIQPILLGTWCTLCLIGAAAMLVQIPYSADELVATCQFLWRRKKQGMPLLRVFFTGGTDDGEWDEDKGDNFEQSPLSIMRDMVSGGLSLPWNLLLCIVIGAWLMFTRLTVNADGAMANADHLVGALAITFAVTALAETFRAFRFLIIPLSFYLLAAPFLYDASAASMISALVCGAALLVLSLRRGKVSNSYAGWDRYIV